MNDVAPGGVTLSSACKKRFSRTSYRINDHCRHCFVHGAFTEPALTIEQMLERCVTIMSEEHIMPAAEARALMEDTLPRLKRWRARSPARLA